MLGLGMQELVIILVIILILFGGKKLPELSRSLSDSVKELRRGFNDDDTTNKNENTKNANSNSGTKL